MAHYAAPCSCPAWTNGYSAGSVVTYRHREATGEVVTITGAVEDFTPLTHQVKVRQPDGTLALVGGHGFGDEFVSIEPAR